MTDKVPASSLSIPFERLTARSVAEDADPTF